MYTLRKIMLTMNERIHISKKLIWTNQPSIHQIHV
ncbi:unnamed protein product [Onchocerca flexuosa]|uniref:Uncharacterized protein n=1 Tax=Onchocerca flexuosa TaxID=387005 RepID=A0A183HT22_9BILA|nr:unnamed protein product [Onchocerca flexuosa]